MKHGKRYIAAAQKIESGKLYDAAEAFALINDIATAKFDETIEAHVKLGVDPRQADQQVRGTVVLPHGTGKSVRVLVIAKGEKADIAEKAGADIVGAEEIIVHCIIGKKSFGADKLKENFDTLMDAIVRAKPAAAKGTYVKSVFVTPAMGPGVKVNVRG